MFMLGRFYISYRNVILELDCAIAPTKFIALINTEDFPHSNMSQISSS